jgi:hypothetical protein
MSTLCVIMGHSLGGGRGREEREYKNTVAVLKNTATNGLARRCKARGEERKKKEGEGEGEGERYTRTRSVASVQEVLFIAPAAREHPSYLIITRLEER